MEMRNLVQGLEQKVEDRRGQAEKEFSEWFSGFESPATRAIAQQAGGEEVGRVILDLVRKCALHAWMAREPEAVLLELMDQAGNRLAHDYAKLKDEVGALRAEVEALQSDNKKLRHTIDCVLEQAP